MSEKFGTLYLIPCPLAADRVEFSLPVSIKQVVGTLNYFVVENAKSARAFLKELGISKEISVLNISEIDKHGLGADTSELLKPLVEGNDIGVVSEAGCPCIADPGAKLVFEAHRLGIRVVPLVGPSSILLALMASGLNGQKFSFCGYLPNEEEDRRKAIKRLESQSRENEETKIFMETPYRSDKLLKELIEICNPESILAIASNLTSEGEFIATKPLKEWKKAIPLIGKSPTMFLLFGFSS